MGYKQTEVGVIPKDWEVGKLNDILVKFQNGYAFSSTGYLKDGIPIITMAQIGLDGNFQFDSNTVNYWSAKYIAKLKDFLLCKGDIIIAMTDVTPQKNLIGRMAIIKINQEFLLNQRVGHLIINKDKVNAIFLVAFSNSRPWRNYSISSASLGVQANIGKKDILAGMIPLPTIQEQTFIAAALSDAEALISSLEKLIAKKRNIKQGAMQELLKPKVGWEIRKMAEIGRPYGGLSGKSKEDFADGNFPYIPFMNIMSNPIIDVNYMDYVAIKSGENQNQAQKGDLFFNGSSETPEEVGMCSVLCDDIPNLYLNSFCFGFRLNKELQTDGLYLAYFFRSSEGRKLLFSLAQGATRYNLSKSNFLKMRLSLPKPEEQTLIANTLKDMDAEISALETKLGKHRMIKKGMMQTLLTGQIRLI